LLDTRKVLPLSGKTDIFSSDKCADKACNNQAIASNVLFLLRLFKITEKTKRLCLFHLYTTCHLIERILFRLGIKRPFVDGRI